jgi:hypothetical protein
MDPERPTHPPGKAIAVIVAVVVFVMLLAVISTLAGR